MSDNVKVLSISTALNGFVVQYGVCGWQEIYPDWDSLSKAVKSYLTGSRQIPDRFSYDNPKNEKA